MWAQESWLACIKFLGGIDQIKCYNHRRQKDFYVSFCNIEEDANISCSFHFAAHIEEENCLWSVIIMLSFGSARMKFYSNIFF
jgi:hypothetical protein